MNGPVISLSRDTKVYPIIRGTNFVTRYGLSEGSCVITNKAAYIYYDTWEKVVKVLAPGIRKINVSNVACVCPILFSVYLTLHLCPSKFSSNDL